MSASSVQTIFAQEALKFHNLAKHPHKQPPNRKWIEQAEKQLAIANSTSSHDFPFDKNVLRQIFDHSQTDLRNKLFNLFRKHEEFYPQHGESMHEERARVMRMWSHIVKTGCMEGTLLNSSTGQDRARFDAVLEVAAVASLSLNIKMSVHYGLFGATIALMSDKVQAARWTPLVERCEMIGCFALTELGHGSNVKGVETIAVYHPERQTFDLHTPSESAQKYWIGGAYHSARWSTVFAQLYVGEQCHGIHPFLVRIRNDDGSPVQGVTLADCGHKPGLNGVDNGRIWFDHVQVPHEHLLRKYSSVSKDGTYHSDIQNPDERFGVSLSSLTGGRVQVAAQSVHVAKKGLTIAIRYALIRRAFGPKNGPETRLIDYPIHQQRLLPHLATTIVHQLAMNQLKNKWYKREFGKELHIWSSGFKSIMSSCALETLQECREACGGQGYKTENQIAFIRTTFDVAVTFEGDNHILLQAVTREVLPQFIKESRIGTFTGHFSYLNDRAGLQHDLQGADVRAPIFWETVFRRREAACFAKLATKLQLLLKKGMPQLQAFNECVDLVEAAAKAHTELLIIDQCQKSITQIREQKHEGIARMLLFCCTLHALWKIHRETDFLRYGAISAKTAQVIADSLPLLCKEMRPLALDLVDSFGVPAMFLAPIAFDYVSHNSRSRL